MKRQSNSKWMGICAGVLVIEKIWSAIKKVSGPAIKKEYSK